MLPRNNEPLVFKPVHGYRRILLNKAVIYDKVTSIKYMITCFQESKTY